ncbi:MAG TPA: hypothetical protein VKR62_09720, partial [Roseiarcus sp.]|nr:hypothetical protein [Roseiarcus sp.]
MTGARRGRLVPTTAIALLALGAASGARAECEVVAGDHVFALLGSACIAPSGAYAPTTPIPVPPSPPPPIVGFFANDGGSITAGAPIAITTSDVGSIGVYATGASDSASTIALTGA